MILWQFVWFYLAKSAVSRRIPRRRRTRWRRNPIYCELCLLLSLSTYYAFYRWQGPMDSYRLACGINEYSWYSPPDCDFKTHLDIITDPENSEDPNPNDYDTIVYVPVLDSSIQVHEVSHDDVIKCKHFRVTGPLCGEFTGHRWIPLHKGHWRGVLMSSLICVWTNGWVNYRDAGDLRHHRVHYDATVKVML